MRRRSHSEEGGPQCGGGALRYGHTERVTCVRVVENRHFCIGNNWFKRVDALHALKQRVRRVSQLALSLARRHWEMEDRHSAADMERL